VVEVCLKFVSVFVAVTVALGTVLPPGSVTFPEILPPAALQRLWVISAHAIMNRRMLA
jgi:hypothetical protein